MFTPIQSYTQNDNYIPSTEVESLSLNAYMRSSVPSTNVSPLMITFSQSFLPPEPVVDTNSIPEDQVCIQESVSTNLDTENKYIPLTQPYNEYIRDQSPITLSTFVNLPNYPYGFDPDIYKSSTLLLPRNILHPDIIKYKSHLSRNKETPSNQYSREHDLIAYHMPHWKQYNPNETERREFVAKFFPERITLYDNYKHEEQKVNLFVYLWIYINGGIYVSSDYELIKSIEPILDSAPTSDSYFMFDSERYISPKFFASQPFSAFWIDVVNLMEKRYKHKYNDTRAEIDRNTGRGLLTDVLDAGGSTLYKYEIIPRSHLDPYNQCDRNYNKDSCLRPVSNDRDFMTYIKCQTGSSDELIYITGAIIFIIIVMVLIALITK